MNILMIVTWVLVLWFAFYVINTFVTRFLAKQRGTVLKANDFIQKQEDSHGQLIDVREKAPYKRSHLKGARNMPTMSFSQGKSGLRHDTAVYLYGDSLQGASSVAKHLRKEGLAKSQIFLMAGGYQRFVDAKKR
ncbi:rhodanese-like domain-containing protein [Fructobacillus ficulneus]|uniref:Rhodanese-related sulfurtransferase n=1 Tax=Fructobacillus ficulneus TaxID=157463 RepID=A0A0K8MIL2_9LACO|nr:rhodanese-like domain-containing protein [Fructobacillus ficulneus]GAO99998.1 rhodanese-related sulfurtransferase [Fructobacillus ficulneus]